MKLQSNKVLDSRSHFNFLTAPWLELPTPKASQLVIYKNYIRYKGGFKSMRNGSKLLIQVKKKQEITQICL